MGENMQQQWQRQQPKVPHCWLSGCQNEARREQTVSRAELKAMK